MRYRYVLATLSLLPLSIPSARADVPTIDAAQLDQHTNIANTKVKLIPIVTNHATADQGIHCAATKGQKGAVTNTTATPNAATGASAVQSAAPSAPTAVSSTATGPTLALQNQGSQTAAVASGISADQQTVTSGTSALSSQGSQVGTSPTVMSAWDANSSARTQQGLTFNNVIGAVAGLAQAYNVANMASIQISSQSGSSLAYPNPAASGGTNNSLCPTWAVGSGTSTSPCVARTSNCTAASATCVEQRYVDSYGNVIFYLASLQDLNQSLNAAGVPPQP